MGSLEVVPNNDDGVPSFHINYNGHTIVHAEMRLPEEQVQVYVWPKECFKDENSMSNFEMFEYPAGFKGDEE